MIDTIVEMHCSLCFAQWKT